jgi:hypothetical protein
MGWQDAPAVDSGSKWRSAPAVDAPAGSPASIPDTPPQPSPPTNEPDLANSLIAGAPEAGLSMISGMGASLAGNIIGAVKFGSDTRAGAKHSHEIGEKYTYQPRSKEAKVALDAIKKFLDESKLGGLNPAMPMGSATRGGAQGARSFGKALVDETAAGEGLSLSKRASVMPGVGSAETSAARMRRDRAGNLPVPLNLTKGQAERDFEQQRFERETAKAGKEGTPLRERYAEQNEQILQNFDVWIDQTGAEAPNLRVTGQVVDQALVNKAKRAKKEVDQAYAAARESGETSRLAPTDEIVQWIEKSRSAAKNAPVISAIEDEIIRLRGATRADGSLLAGHMTINDLEEIRKMVGRLAEPGTPNMPYGIDAKKLIDAATEGRGGALYTRARKLRSDYAREFEDHAVVSKLLRTKPGTADRAVAYEDIFSHSILDGSLDDVRIFARTIKSAGPQGERAWRELQGATIAHIRDEITKNVATDIRGNRIVSASKLDKLVADLDRDGKLDYIFGKPNAQKLRDINDLAKDVYTSPPGAVNTSNTGSVLLQALGEIGTGHLSIGTAKALATAKKIFEGRKTRKRIRESLADRPLGEMTEEERAMPVKELE